MSTFYLLKITLVDSKPCIWRRVAAPSDTSLRELHYVIQTVMAWENDHPHVFYLGKNPLAEPSVPFSSDSEEDDLILEDILPLKNRKKPLTYVYDFGDDWIHEITLEDKNYQKSEDTADFVCIDGEFAPPPDDIGGVYEYADIYVCLKNKTPLPKHYDGWFAKDYDPDFFDIELINDLLDERLCTSDDDDDDDDDFEEKE